MLVRARKLPPPFQTVCVRITYAMPLRMALSVGVKCASKAMSPHAVCEAVDGPRPARCGDLSERNRRTLASASAFKSRPMAWRSVGACGVRSVAASRYAELHGAALYQIFTQMYSSSTRRNTYSEVIVELILVAKSAICSTSSC